jgi:hypothetical protein
MACIGDPWDSVIHEIELVDCTSRDVLVVESQPALDIEWECNLVC